MEKIYFGNWSSSLSVTIYEEDVTNLDKLETLLNNLKEYNKILLGINREGIIIDDGPDKADIINLENVISDLELKINSLYTSAPFEKKDTELDITGEFYLLFNFLPEHIKKELKIYIKK